MLYLVGFFLLFIIILIVITLVVFKKSKPQSCEINPQPTKDLSLDDLLKTLKTQKKEVARIEEALVLMCRDFPFPENENEANKHFEFVYFFAKNPLTSAKLIVKMQKELTAVNPRYAKQIENFQMRGVEARK